MQLPRQGDPHPLRPWWRCSANGWTRVDGRASVEAWGSLPAIGRAGGERYEGEPAGPEPVHEGVEKMLAFLDERHPMALLSWTELLPPNGWSLGTALDRGEPPPGRPDPPQPIVHIVEADGVRVAFHVRLAGAVDHADPGTFTVHVHVELVEYFGVDKAGALDLARQAVRLMVEAPDGNCSGKE